MSEAVASAVQTYAADPTHSEVGFTVRHMVVSKVRGQFSKFSATIAIPEGSAIPSSFEATIDAASITTREENRDNHLRSADFFDVEKYSDITFKSQSIEKKNENEFTVTGLLTIRDVTKAVTFTSIAQRLGKDPWGNQRVGFEATLRVAREDFGLTWNQALEAGGVLVSSNVDINLEIQAVLAA